MLHSAGEGLGCNLMGTTHEYFPFAPGPTHYGAMLKTLPYMLGSYLTLQATRKATPLYALLLHIQFIDDELRGRQRRRGQQQDACFKHPCLPSPFAAINLGCAFGSP